MCQRNGPERARPSGPFQVGAQVCNVVHAAGGRRVAAADETSAASTRA